MGRPMNTRLRGEEETRRGARKISLEAVFLLVVFSSEFSLLFVQVTSRYFFW